MDEQETQLENETVSDEGSSLDTFGTASEDVVKKLREQLRTCETERKEYLDGWQRAKADFVNARKTEERERLEFAKLVKEPVLADFLAIADAFELAFSHKELWERVDVDWRRGVESIYSQLIRVFTDHGLRPIGAVGESFDPRLHIAVASVAVEQSNADHTVVALVEHGYELNGKVIRPAKVKVGELG